MPKLRLHNLWLRLRGRKPPSLSDSAVFYHFYEVVSKKETYRISNHYEEVDIEGQTYYPIPVKLDHDGEGLIAMIVYAGGSLMGNPILRIERICSVTVYVMEEGKEEAFEMWKGNMKVRVLI